MNSLTKIWKLILWSAVLIGLFIIVPKIVKTPPASFTEVIKYDTIPGDTVYIKVNHYLPGKDSIHYDTIPSEVDTMVILKDYYSKVYYSDTITNDSTFSLIVNDIISQNSLIHRETFYKNLQGQIIKTVTKYPAPINRYYIGGEVLMSQKSQSLYITGTMCTKKDRIYTFGFDPILKGFNIGFAINIKHK